MAVDGGVKEGGRGRGCQVERESESGWVGRGCGGNTS